MAAQTCPTGEAKPQCEVVAFMMDPATHGGAEVEHVETHISHVFLAGDAAYKMKKAVRLDFVDFSTLAARKDACAGEIDVNTRTAPDIYRDMVAVNDRGGRLSLGAPAGAPDRAVEYLVRMRRFDQRDLFERIVAERRLTTDHIYRMADAVAALHLNAARVAHDPQGQDFEAAITNLARSLSESGTNATVRGLVAEWHGRVRDTLPEVMPLIRARARHGAVRHGHGDLHLRNICLFRGRVRLFDAIEFEPKFSHVDILYDSAFLIMDLIHRGHPDAAALFLSCYLTATRDYTGLKCLPLFVSVRAAIRALVDVLDPDPARQEEAEAYLRLAIAQASIPSTPRLVAIGGRSGTGKSTLARGLIGWLAQGPDWVMIRSDEVRKRLLGVTPETGLDASAYSAEIGAQVYHRLIRDAARALRAGARVLVDATFLAQVERKHISALVPRCQFTGIWLAADDATLQARLRARVNDASDADEAVLAKQREPRSLPDWHRIDAGQNPKDMLRAAVQVLRPR